MERTPLKLQLLSAETTIGCLLRYLPHLPICSHACCPRIQDPEQLFERSKNTHGSLKCRPSVLPAQREVVRPRCLIPNVIRIGLIWCHRFPSLQSVLCKLYLWTSSLVSRMPTSPSSNTIAVEGSPSRVSSGESEQSLHQQSCPFKLQLVLGIAALHWLFPGRTSSLAKKNNHLSN